MNIGPITIKQSFKGQSISLRDRTKVGVTFCIQPIAKLTSVTAQIFARIIDGIITWYEPSFCKTVTFSFTPGSVTSTFIAEGFVFEEGNLERINNA